MLSLWAFYAKAQSGTLNLKHVWVEPNESEQLIVSTLNGYAEANNVLNTLLENKNYAIKLYIYNGQEHYFRTLNNAASVGDMLGGNASFSTTQIQQDYQNSVQTQLEELSQKHQQKAQQFVAPTAQPQLTRTILLNLTLLQKVLTTQETTAGGLTDIKIVRKNHTKLQVAWTNDLEDNIRGKFATILSRFDLELTENIAQNNLAFKELAGWACGNIIE